MDVNIQKYITFVRVVESGSFTRAALALNYSQSAISRMIDDLEQDWGLRLLERGRSGLCLTSDGEKLLPYARAVCHEYEMLQAEAASLRGLESGLIRIGTFSSVATHWLPKIIGRFQKDYPHIEYELLLGDYPEIENWIAEGRVDCGFTRLPARSDLDVLPLGKDRLLAVLPHRHPLSLLQRVPITALADFPFMLLEKDGFSDAADLLRQNGVQARVKFITWDDYAIMSMVESGLGISILPELILRRTPYHIETKELDVPAFREIGLCTKSGTAKPRAVTRFIEYLNYR